MVDPISRRPQGRSSSESRENSSARDTWDKIVEPGGFKLWCQLVIGFTSMAVLGTVFIALGAAMFEYAYSFHQDGNTALPLALCVIAMVCGAIMFFGSIILGKLVISSKWRKNQQPDYSRRQRITSTRVRYTATSRDSSTQMEIEIPPPPPYDINNSNEYGQAHPSIYIVGSELHIDSQMPPPVDMRLKPPDYTEISAKPPSYAQINDIDNNANVNH